MPEDVCFYRGDKLWFVTNSHERVAWRLQRRRTWISLRQMVCWQVKTDDLTTNSFTVIYIEKTYTR
jgi:hypothetical protein